MEMSIQEFLQWLFASGGSIVAASWIFERIAWFQAQSADSKEWIFFGLSSLIAVASYLTITFVPQEILAAIAPYFNMVAGVFYLVVIGKKFHEIDKK